MSVKFKSHWWLSSGWNIKCWINYISSGCGGEGRKMSIFISFSCNPLNLFWSCWLSSGLDLNPSRGFNQMCNQTKWMYCIWFDPILFYQSRIKHNLSISKYKILFLSALSMLIKTVCWQKEILNKFLVQYVNTIIIRTLYGVMSPYLYILTLILSKHVIKMALTRILNKYKEKNCSEHKPFRKIGVINL